MTGSARWRLEDELTYALRAESVPHVYSAFHPQNGVLALGDLAFAFTRPRRSKRLFCYLLDDPSEVSRLVLDLGSGRAELSQKRRSRGTTDERSRKLHDVELDCLSASVVTAAFVKLKLRTKYANVEGAEAFQVDFDLIIPVDHDWRLVRDGIFHHLEIESRHPRWEAEQFEKAAFSTSLASHLQPGASKPQLVRAYLDAPGSYAPLPDARGLIELKDDHRRRLRELSKKPPIRDFLRLARER